MGDVLFVVMPFCGLESPQLGVSLLKAQLRARGIGASIAYLNFAFAEALGGTTYRNVQQRQSCLAGEWMFSRAVFPKNRRDQEFVEHARANQLCTSEVLEDVCRAAGLVEPFLDHCLRTIDWSRYSVVGFTSTFEQNLASLALAGRIKRRYPDKILVMGGSNCSGIMGAQLHRSVPFIDYVFTGESDLSFPELVTRLANGNRDREDIPGYARREGSSSVAASEGHLLDNLDALAYPDFDDYFAAYRTSSLRDQFTPMLQIETARGCWWGAKHHCTFCGLNPHGMAFRCKSAERAMDELMHLVSRYGTNRVFVVDNIIDMSYFRTFLPDLKRRSLPIQLFYETKANLKREQVRMFAEAGVTVIQPGIESFSTHVLGLMRKGVSPLQNVQVLKWARQYGVHPTWNILFGFPGEQAVDYDDTYRIAEQLSHLTPPVYTVAVSVERFSPYFENAADFGIRNMRAHPLYSYVYPFDDEVLYNLAYFFECDYEGKDNIEAWSPAVERLVERWKLVHTTSYLDVVARDEEGVTIRDTRPDAVYPWYRFRVAEAAVLEACDQAQTLPQIVKDVRQALNGSIPKDDTWISDFVRYLRDCNLVLEHDGRYCSLVLSEPRPPSRPEGWPIFS